MGEVLVTVIVEEASLSNPGVIGSKIQEKRETKKKKTKKKKIKKKIKITQCWWQLQDYYGDSGQQDWWLMFFL